MLYRRKSCLCSWIILYVVRKHVSSDVLLNDLKYDELLLSIYGSKGFETKEALICKMGWNAKHFTDQKKL